MIGATAKKFLGFSLFALIGAVSLSGVDLAPDYRKIDPLVMATDNPAIAAAQRKAMAAPGRADLPVPVFIHLSSDDPGFPARLPNLGGSGRKVTGRLYIGSIPRDAARYLSNWPQVAYIESAKRVKPLLDLSRPAVTADIVQAGTGLPSPFDTGITGAGTYVGIVDTGLDNTHLDFHTGGSGSPLRVAHTYSNASELILEGLDPNPLVDENGHGTHVTGIAAGNGYSSGGTYTGMAPGAGILFGKTSFFDTDIINAVSNLIAFAEGASKPISVNLSLGGTTGPHDGTSGFESAINSLSAGAAGSKRVVVVAAGNEKGAGEHYQATLDAFGTNTISIAFVASTTSGSVDIWADGNDQYTVTAVTGTDCVTVLSGAPTATSPLGKITVSNKVTSPPNGATNISVFFQSLTIPKTATIRLDRTRNAGTGKVDAYIDSTDGTFSGATDAGTIIEPANGKDVLAVASFNTKNFPAGPAAQNISSFSSVGLTRDGRQKPDVAAPGAYLYSTRSFGAPPFNYYALAPGNDNYAILAGTSMAAPHVTGIAALVWESNPSLTGAQLRERIRWTAAAPTDGSTVPNATWGYGKVNALRAVSHSVASITSPSTATPGQAVTLTSENSSGAFGDASLAYAWSLPQKPSGSGATLSSAAPSTTFTPDIPGNYTIGLTVTDPSAASPGSATTVLHVNNLPAASISGPASGEVGVPVSFSGLGSSDADLQSLAYRWVLVSRPAGSAASISGSSTDNVTFTSDVLGTYEIGLRVDDGVDNSALALRTFTAETAATPSSGDGGGGGGGCSISGRTTDEGNLTHLATTFVLLSPIALLAIRRRFRRDRHPIC